MIGWKILRTVLSLDIQFEFKGNAKKKFKSAPFLNINNNVRLKNINLFSRLIILMDKSIIQNGFSVTNYVKNEALYN